jgi:hypothetical protein
MGGKNYFRTGEIHLAFPWKVPPRGHRASPGQVYNLGMLRKFAFSVAQGCAFYLEVLRGRGRVGWKIVECDWPHSPTRARFLILGVLEIPEDKIFCKVWGKTYKLSKAPQRNFYQCLDKGEDIKSDPYYLESKAKLDDQSFQLWLNDRLALRRSYQADPFTFTPVVVRTSVDTYIVEDGGHRLALQSLRGKRTHLVGVSVWNFEPR